MKNLELFNKSVGILVDAYRNNTLQHGNCFACAVGNLIASNNKYEFSNLCGNIIFWANFPSPKWHMVFGTPKDSSQYLNIEKYEGNAKKQIDSTGYVLYELARIEKAFELAHKGNNDDDWMFNGLLAVYDVLCDIHEMDKKEVIKGELIFIK